MYAYICKYISANPFRYNIDNIHDKGQGIVTVGKKYWRYFISKLYLKHIPIRLGNMKANFKQRASSN